MKKKAAPKKNAAPKKKAAPRQAPERKTVTPMPETSLTPTPVPGYSGGFGAGGGWSSEGGGEEE